MKQDGSEKEALVEEFMDELLIAFEAFKRNAKGQTLEDKLRESIRCAKGKYPQSDQELRDELASLDGTLVP
jgi:hypothetical protein